MSRLGWNFLTRRDRDAILKGIASGSALGGPYHVEIHPADRCNIDCFFCSTASIRGTDELPLSKWAELLAEMKAMGVRSLRLSGGGEPLFHRRIGDFLQAVATSGIPIENVTTNAVLLTEPNIRLLAAARCQQITVSLNTASAASYAEMMKTPERNFDRVLENVRKLQVVKQELGSSLPRLNVQFLVWKGNFEQIPRMYSLARELGADSIIFNGLAFLADAQKMSEAESARMMELYEEVVREDEFRRITSIESFEQDIRPGLDAIVGRLSKERALRPIGSRLSRFVSRKDVGFTENLSHFLWMRLGSLSDRLTREFLDTCIIGWYALVVRTNGDVAPCCILQGKSLGNIYRQSLREIWYGDDYTEFRSELRTLFDEPATHGGRFIEPMCGRGEGVERCPIKSFYFRPDVAFTRRLQSGTSPSGGREKVTSSVVGRGGEASSSQ
ncbi:MAG: radical SAM protein [Thermoanaerobaculia bacterium]|nr:radical SAM protein [Thermoanaerobaculia bacterium]